MQQRLLFIDGQQSAISGMSNVNSGVFYRGAPFARVMMHRGRVRRIAEDEARFYEEDKNWSLIADAVPCLRVRCEWIVCCGRLELGCHLRNGSVGDVKKKEGTEGTSDCQSVSRTELRPLESGAHTRQLIWRGKAGVTAQALLHDPDCSADALGHWGTL